MDPEQPTESPAAHRARTLRILQRNLSYLYQQRDLAGSEVPEITTKQIAATEQMIGKLEEETEPMTLEEALDRLVALLPVAQQRWEQQQREEDEEYESGDDQLWLALELRYGGWRCGYVCQPDEATEVAYSAVAGSALGAATALLAMMEKEEE